MDTTDIQKLENLIVPLLEEGLFLVQVKVKPTNNYKVYIDSDKGVDIADTIKLNRALRAKMEEAAWHPEGDFSLEVSSPGVDEPLKLLRQYRKNVGRPVEVHKADGTRLEGKLIGTSDENITIEQVIGKGKKAETVHTAVPFSEIKQTIVQIKF